MRRVRKKPSHDRPVKRYTSLSAAIDVLSMRRLALLFPRTWDDQNDPGMLERYRQLKGYGTVLAACFTKAPETYHHWKIFAGSPEGVCLQIDEDALIKSAGSDSRVSWQEVSYWTIEQMRDRNADVDELPFTKRKAFEAEEEFRMIFCCTEQMQDNHYVPLEPSAIRGIVLSPWLPDILVESVKKTLCSIADCGKVQVTRSRLTNSPSWQRAVAKALNLPSSTFLQKQ